MLSREVRIKGGRASQEVHRKNNTGVFDPQRKLARSGGKALMASLTKEERFALSARGATAYVANRRKNGDDFFSPEARDKGGRVGGPISQALHRKNQTGAFDPAHWLQRMGGHARNHTKRGIFKPTCEFCLEESGNR